MGVITISLDDDAERILREIAGRRGKKKGALGETIAELLKTARNDEIASLLEELKRGFPINVGKIKRDELYEDRTRY